MKNYLNLTLSKLLIHDYALNEWMLRLEVVQTAVVTDHIHQSTW